MAAPIDKVMMKYRRHGPDEREHQGGLATGSLHFYPQGLAALSNCSVMWRGTVLLTQST
jgi:hypothetical protein